MSKETMKLALEALEASPMSRKNKDAIDALRSALAEQPAQQGPVATLYGSLPVYDKPAQQALDKKAENARELGLDYEPAQQEPYGYVWFNKNMEHRFTRMKPHPDMGAMHIKPIYTSPPAQRTWVGLTDEERDAMIGVTDLSGAYYYDDLYAVILAAEAKLKEKNT